MSSNISSLEDGHNAPLSGRPPGDKRPPPAKGWFWMILILLGIGIGVFLFWTKSGAKQKGLTGKDAKSTISVVGVKAVKGDIGVYFTGLGSAIPLYTVTVKTRVDGQLMKVLFREGQFVQEGDLLVEIDSRSYEAQLAQAQGQLAHDEAQLKNGRIDLERYKALWSQDAIPQQTLATQEATVSQYEGTIESDQALIDSAKLNITYCHITAPISGRVGLRLVDAGNIVHASDATGLLVITQVQPITVVFTLAEDYLPPILKKLNAGQELSVDAYARDTKTKLAQGSLLTGDNQIDQTTGTLKFKAIFPNDDNALFPNQFVNVRLLVEMKQGVTLVPPAAIQRGSQGTFVYVVKSDQTTAVRPVTVGTTEADAVEVQSGLSPGEIVVIDGVDKLQDSKVELQLKSWKAPEK